jgi:DNA-binding transcriptional MerR regulator
MGRYRVHQFAELAGVTVKALHHYDRLGLLTPLRTEAGYRVYRERDLERLEQIVALKFLGLSLRQIKTVLERTALALPDALRAQRKAIEEKQVLLARAARAIRAAEESMAAGKPADPATLRKIIEVIDMQNSIELMKKYYTGEAWERRRRYYEDGPSAEWLQLYRDANALLAGDPASEAAQTVADRWLKLSVRAWTGDPDVQTDSPTAWMDRANWPAAMKQRLPNTTSRKSTNLSSKRRFPPARNTLRRRPGPVMRSFAAGPWKIRKRGRPPGRRGSTCSTILRPRSMRIRRAKPDRP